MLKVRVGKPSTMYGYQQVRFRCHHCGRIEQFLMENDRYGIPMTVSIMRVNCKECFTVFPDVDRLIANPEYRMVWHKTKVRVHMEMGGY